MTKYLQPRNYYEDIYDLHTIEQCLSWFNNLKNGMEKHRTEFVPEPPHHTDYDHEVLKVCSYFVNNLAIERYRQKRDSIEKWMAKDKLRQEFFDNAKPTDPVCDKCGSFMQVIDKNMHEPSNEKPKITFMYECTKCKYKKVLNEDGSVWEYEKPLCPECKSELEEKMTHKGEILKTTTTCPKCDYKNIDIIDFKISRERREKEEKRKAWLFKEYREQFCLDEVKGDRAIQDIDRMKRLVEEWKDREKKDRDPVYKAARSLKKLKFNELKELISNSIEHDGYSDLQFQAPEMGRNVIVAFTASDTKNDRHEYDSRNVLKKAIVKALKGTNWRLMSDGISYRIGIRSGRLKAYESEEELVELVK